MTTKGKSAARVGLRLWTTVTDSETLEASKDLNTFYGPLGFLSSLHLLRLMTFAFLAPFVLFCTYMFVRARIGIAESPLLCPLNRFKQSL